MILDFIKEFHSSSALVPFSPLSVKIQLRDEHHTLPARDTTTFLLKEIAD